MNIYNFKLQDMSISNFTQRTVSNIGGKGTGKTTLLKMAISELRDMPAVIFDPLCVIEIPGINSINVKRSHVGMGKPAGIIVNKLVKNKTKVIIKFVDLIGPEIVEFMDAFLREVHMKDGLWFFDEIHEFTPEVGSIGGKYSVEAERLIRHTRNDNNGVWMTTQRPAFTSKKVLALSDFMILFRLIYPNDLKVIRELTGNNAVVDSLPSKSFLESWCIDYDVNSGKYLNKSQS